LARSLILLDFKALIISMMRKFAKVLEVLIVDELGRFFRKTEGFVGELGAAAARNCHSPGGIQRSDSEKSIAHKWRFVYMYL
jgi:hypothetical protein